ncbi:MAG: DUF4139 domain-containing protein, partial [Candidatus Omnitrophica bacterium]|nr:DUF4139 domain-containing protein [Candidatus Omnitrophota bacterium]
YEYDLMNQQKLLDKYVGKGIQLMQWHEYQDRKEIVDAVLISNNEGPVYKIQDQIYLGYPGTQILPAIPDNLIEKPTLMWLYDNRAKPPQQIEVTYLTGNIGWKADYVLSVSADDTLTDLSGWVTVDNRSGATYRNAKLQLVAGDINRVQEEINAMPRFAIAEKAMGVGGPAFESQAFFEYHLYNLKRKTTIKDNQTKQINFIEASNVRIAKEYEITGMPYFFTQAYRTNDYKVPVTVYLNFKNSKKNNLGMPLPAGVMRLYKKDKEGSLQFIGEDRIEHTPEDEKVRLELGKAFDLTAERIQTDFKQVTTRLYETEWKVSIRNHKDQDVTVHVTEKMSGNWNILKSNVTSKKKDAYTIQFDVKVPKKGQAEVVYRVSVGI